MVEVKRIYDPWEKGDGFRVLVDRLWPRGMTKEKARVDQWLKEIAPSHDLRKRFHDHTLAWEGFKQAYAHELTQKSELLLLLKELEQSQDCVTLLYAVKNTEQNHAQLIKDFMSFRI